MTSNYSIADILADLEDRELRTAIMRRFTRFEMLSRDEIKRHGMETTRSIHLRLWPPCLNEWIGL